MHVICNPLRLWALARVWVAAAALGAHAPERAGLISATLPRMHVLALAPDSHREAIGLLAREALVMILAQTEGGARGDAAWALLYPLGRLLAAVSACLGAPHGVPLAVFEAGAAAGVSAVRRALFVARAELRATADVLAELPETAARFAQMQRSVAAALKRANAARGAPMDKLVEAARAWTSAEKAVSAVNAACLAHGEGARADRARAARASLLRWCSSPACATPLLSSGRGPADGRGLAWRRACRGCRVVKYCCEACAAADWPAHALVCGFLAADGAR